MTNAADQVIQPPLRLLVEKRFPLEMNVTLPEIRELYDSGKAGRWNPHRDIDWDALSPDRYDEPTRLAARRAWSRRGWIEATGLTETPALTGALLHGGRTRDRSKILSHHPQHRRSLAHRVLRQDRGRRSAVASPVRRNAAMRPSSTATCTGACWMPSQHLDSYVAVHAAFEDGLELELCRAWRTGATNSAIAAVLDRVIADKERHAAFGWLYLASRAAHWTADERLTIAEELAVHVRDTELRGYHCPWLAPEHASVEAQADAAIAAAGSRRGQPRRRGRGADQLRRQRPRPARRIQRRAAGV